MSVSRLGGRITAVSGGLYVIDCEDGSVRRCKARGSFRHEIITPLVGDFVTLELETDGAFIAEIAERRSALIRPPLANLELLFITAAAVKPEPLALNIDKLTCIAEHNRITPVIVITKRDLAPEEAERLAAIYRLAGYDAFATNVSEPGDPGMAALKEYIRVTASPLISAFAGASGVGKSTLLGTLYPQFSPATGELSRKIERGRQTTRSVTLFPTGGGGYIADTPGFSMLDFTRFDFMEEAELELEFREFAPYLGKCRYTDCSHTKEEGCAVLEAAAAGLIAESRLDSYRALKAELHLKKKY